jgi:hypothetical protein
VQLTITTADLTARRALSTREAKAGDDVEPPSRDAAGAYSEALVPKLTVMARAPDNLSRVLTNSLSDAMRNGDTEQVRTACTSTHCPLARAHDSADFWRASATVSMSSPSTTRRSHHTSAEPGTMFTPSPLCITVGVSVGVPSSDDFALAIEELSAHRQLTIAVAATSAFFPCVCVCVCVCVGWGTSEKHKRESAVPNNNKSQKRFCDTRHKYITWCGNAE